MTPIVILPQRTPGEGHDETSRLNGLKDPEVPGRERDLVTREDAFRFVRDSFKTNVETTPRPLGSNPCPQRTFPVQYPANSLPGLRDTFESFEVSIERHIRGQTAHIQDVRRPPRVVGRHGFPIDGAKRDRIRARSVPAVHESADTDLSARERGGRAPAENRPAGCDVPLDAMERYVPRFPAEPPDDRGQSPKKREVVPVHNVGRWNAS